MLKKIGKCLLVWVTTLAVLFGLLLAASLIPNSAIKENICGSTLEYQYHEPHEAAVNGVFHSIADYYADVILLNIMWNVDSGDVFRSALDTKYYDGGDYGEVYGLYVTAQNAVPANTDYTRYWHGSMIYLRPLFAVTDAGGARIAIAVALGLLLVFNCFLLLRKKRYAVTAMLLLSLAAVQAWYVPLSFEYCSVFLVLLTIFPFVIARYNDNAFLICVFAAAGTATAFFDFLTAETLTLLVPPVLTLVLRRSDGKSCGYRENMRPALGFLLPWGISYALTFPAKWALASLVTGENKFAAALSSAAERVSGGVDDMDFLGQTFSALGANLTMLFPMSENINALAVTAALLIEAAAVALILVKSRGKAERGFALAMLTLAAVPYLRFLTLSNHSYLHCYFTYRAQAAAVLALSAALWYTFAATRKNDVKGKVHGN